MAGGRTLTVLVADLVDSTRINTMLGAERADEFRRSLFTRFEGAIGQHDGTLVKTLGDGCLGTFGAAAGAIAAAIDIHIAIARLSRQTPGLKVRIGLAVGDVTEEDGDVFGSAIVVATRLCGAAAPDQILVTDVVRALAGGRGSFEWERVGELFLKGIEEPVAASAVRGPAGALPHAPLPRALEARPSEVVVGRHEQLDFLGRAWKDVVVGERRAVLLAGEPGVGKTRLAAEQARRAHTDGALVLFGRCEEDLAAPYEPFVDALKTAVTAVEPELVSAHVTACAGELRRLVPNLNAPDPVEADPHVERSRLFTAVADFLSRVMAEQPVVLVLDDIHWAAPATVQLIRHLLVADEIGALLILATYRDTEVDRQHALGGLLADIPRLDGADRLVLRGLDRAGLEELVVAASGDSLDSAGRELASALHSRTAGNPFFAGQVLRHLAEAGTLVQEDGRWQTGAVVETDLPEGVLDVVGRRLSRLSDNANQALSVAAVAGLSFSHAVIDRVPDVDDAIEGLAEAVAARLLTEDDHGGYSFTHAIVRDALLRELTAAGRAKRHRDLARAVLSIHGDGVGPHLLDLAYHFTEAALLGDVRETARFAVAAAKECSRQADLRAAIDILTRAWTVIDAVEPIDHEARFDVCLALGEAHYRLVDGEYDATVAAVESARQLRSPDRLIQVSMWSARLDIGVEDAFTLAVLDDALELLGPEPSAGRAMALARRALVVAMLPTGDPRSYANDALWALAALSDPDGDTLWAVNALVGIALAAQGNAEDAVEVVQAAKAAPRTEASLGIDTGMLLWAELSHHLALGDAKATQDSIARLGEEAERRGDPLSVVWSRADGVLLTLAQGRFDEAMALAGGVFADIAVIPPNVANGMEAWALWLAFEQGRSRDLAPAVQGVMRANPGVPAFKAALALLLAEIGDDEAAGELVRDLASELPDLGHNLTFAVLVWMLAAAAARVGDEQAAVLVEPYLEPYAGELMVVGAILCVGAADSALGGILTVLGRHDEAVAALEAGLALEEGMGFRPLAARSSLWLANALRARAGDGDAERARALLERSRDTAAELGMRSLQEDTQALLDM